uniref:Fatty acid-binding protein, brain-like n=1 Tax=Phallusia mammillata TaxID=59560 RepID=A0A6F9DCA9_9ASCI|nr:fatty acid-binding protein, brain-like [Phallusia mammillata]
MKAVGVGFALRKIGNATKSTVSIESSDPEAVKIVTSSTFSTHRLECPLGKVVDQQTVDGRNCKTVVNWKNDVLVQEESWNGKTTSISRHVNESGNLIAVSLKQGLENMSSSLR